MDRVMEGTQNAMEMKRNAQDSYRRGEFQQSIWYAKQWLSIVKEMGNEIEEAAEAYNVLGRSYYWVKDYVKSIEHCKQALIFAKKIECEVLEIDAYKFLAWSYYEVGDYDNSIEHGKRVLSSAREMGDQEEEEEGYRVVAKSYHMVGDYEKNIEHGKQALSCAKVKGNKTAAPYRFLALSYYMAGDYEKSIEHGKEALSSAKEIGHKEEEATACNVLAKSYHGLGDHIQANEYSKLQRNLQKRASEDQSYFLRELKKAGAAATGGFSNGSSAVHPGYHPGTDDVYNMTARPRGITLIINNKLFDDRFLKRVPIKDPTRHGSEEDAREVEALFDALGFDVFTEENLSGQQLLNLLDWFACEDHSGYDCFVLWLMSHGNSGEVFCSDGVTVPIQIAHDKFSKCDTLSGKPKLFFIQACRGYEEDEGVTVKVDNSTSIPLSSSHVDSPINTVKPSASKVPTHGDFLYSFSTVDEHVSYRHIALGSYYVRALVEVFRERAAFDHLLDILTAVHDKVSDMEATLSSVENKSDIKIFKQIPEVRHTLRKKVRF